MRSDVASSAARMRQTMATLVLIGSSLAVAAHADPVLQTPVCHDARTGNSFMIHAAKFAVDGSGVSDSTIASRLCIGAATGVYAVPVNVPHA